MKRLLRHRFLLASAAIVLLTLAALGVFTWFPTLAFFQETDSSHVSITAGTWAPDLAPAALTAPANGTAGQSIPVTWTITNQGDGIALPSWSDAVYLSTDSAWDGTDARLTTITRGISLSFGSSYTVTASVALPAVSGNYYLIVKTDADSALAESDESNNNRGVSITIVAPELAPTSLLSQPIADVAQTIPITWTITNQGTSDALPSWQDRIYLSTDSTWDVSDVYVTTVTQGASLAAGSTYTVTQNVIVPWVPAGHYFFVVRTDMWNQVVESDETNNTLAVPFDVGIPDLTPISLLAQSIADVGQTIPITWTIRNQGHADASPSWYDRLYLSTDEVWDGADVFLTNVARAITLTGGSSYSVTQNIMMPWVTPGHYFLIARTDMWNQVGETDETNNLRTLPITVGMPDLTPTSLLSQGVADLGQTVPITWSVRNQGHLDASPSWHDRVYLSTDSTWDGADTFLVDATRDVTLTAGSSYTVTESVTVPWLAPGHYFLIVRTDMWGSLTESDETNNTRTLPIVVGIPDLTPTALTAPAAAVGWQTIPLDWTIKNQGHGNADPSWQDRVYLSTDTTWDSADIFLTSVTHAVTATAGSSYSVTQNVGVPMVADGTYYLLLRTDMWNSVNETDETNNVRSVSLEIGPPDLTPTALQAPTTAEVGQTIALTYTVKNQGLSDALPTWYDRVYLSTDTVWDGADVLLTNVARTLALTPGSTYSVSQNATVPWVAAGHYYLILRTDMWDNVPESDETNNLWIVPIGVGMADLVPTELTAPGDSLAGHAITLTWTIKNQGHGDAAPTWQDRVYLSTDTTWDSGDTFVTSVTHSVTETAASTYTVSQSVAAPWVAAGTYYLILRTDMWNQVTETNETNNVRYVSIKIGPPDLTPTALVSPAVADIGQTVPLTWTVNNQGNTAALTPWYDRVYLSTDEVWDPADAYLTTVTRTLNLAPGSSYTTSQSATMPWVTPGGYYLLLRTDMWNNVAESDETNNVLTLPITIGIPDLTPTEFQTPSMALAGQTVPLTWTIKNQGRGDAAPSWQDRVYLSTDTAWDSGDVFVTSVTPGVTATAGSSYSVSQSVAVPWVAAGHYYLILRTDMWDQVGETNETNNDRIAAINIGPSDLTPTAFAAPATALAGQTTPITWTITNQGNGDAAPSWQDRVFLSTDTVWDGADVFLTVVTRTLALTAGNSYTVTQNVRLPLLPADHYHLILRTDHWNGVAESDETNNVRTLPIILELPDLAPTAFTIPSTALAGQTVPVTWTIKNQGTGNAATTWYDRVYLSTDGTWDAADIFVTNVTVTLSLTPGGSYSMSQTVVVPWVAPGHYYLLLRTDMWNHVAESNEINNVRAVPINVGPPDLAPTAFTAPGTAQVGETVAVTWTVTNAGFGDDLPPWTDKVYVSTKSVFDSTATQLAAVVHNTKLTSGSSYSATANVTLPAAADNYYLILRTDADNAVSESNETNNASAVAIVVHP